MILDVSMFLVTFTILAKDDPILPIGPQIYKGKPVVKMWADHNATVSLDDSTHQWMTDHSIQYEFMYQLTADNMLSQYQVDIPDLDSAILFKLRWG